MKKQCNMKVHPVIASAVKISNWLSRSIVVLVLSTLIGQLSYVTNPCCADDATSDAVMAGYLLAPNEKVPEKYNAGFSMYVAAVTVHDPVQCFLKSIWT